MPIKQLPNSQLPKALYTLDLHGYKKSEGLSRTTDFLDRTTRLINGKDAWVQIITGSGAHSPHGPVLRGAIEALLLKRKIDYIPMKGGGSFLVNASSGYVLYDPVQPTDSKVIVAEPPASSSSNNDGPYRARTLMGANKRPESAGGGRKELKKSFYKRVNEELAYDKVVSESLEQTKRKDREAEMEKELLERAVGLSLLDKEMGKEDEEKIHKAIEISKRESIVIAMDEDEQIRKLMALSKMEFECQIDPDACLKQAIELSRNESNAFDEQMLTILRDSATRYKEENQREDEDILKALELSVVEF